VITDSIKQVVISTSSLGIPSTTASFIAPTYVAQEQYKHLLELLKHIWLPTTTSSIECMENQATVLTANFNSASNMANFTSICHLLSYEN
jgi:hypothetical protein